MAIVRIVADRLPLFPLGTVLFPGAALPLHVFEPRYRALVEDLLAGPEPRSFGVVAIREGHEVGADSVRALHEVGCVAVVREVQRAPDGRYGLLTFGGRRFRLLDIDRSRAYLQADVQQLDEPAGGDKADEWATKARVALAAYAEVRGATVGELPAEPTALSYAVAAALAVDLPERQALLAAPDTTARLATEVALLTRETAVTRTLGAVPLAAPPVPRSSLN